MNLEITFCVAAILYGLYGHLWIYLIKKGQPLDTVAMTEKLVTLQREHRYFFNGLLLSQVILAVMASYSFAVLLLHYADWSVSIVGLLLMYFFFCLISFVRYLFYALAKD